MTMPRYPAIYLGRHCKTQWNLDHRIQGSCDLPLCSAGIDEARAMLPLVAQRHFTRIVSSPYKRARQTADIYADALNLPVEIHADLKEIDHGQWEKQIIDELLQSPQNGYADWLADPGAIAIPGGHEPVDAAGRRVCRAIVNIAAADPAERILVILHKHIRALLQCRLKNLATAAFSSQISEDIAPAAIPPAQIARLCRAIENIPVTDSINNFSRRSV